METRHSRLTTFNPMLMTLVLSIIMCQAEEIRTKPKMVILESPPGHIHVLSGSSVDFVWKFRVFPPNAIHRIAWYFVIYTGNRKDNYKLIQKTFKANSSAVSKNFNLKRKQDRVNCTFKVEDEIWTMSCSLENTRAWDDSASYGIKVDFHGGTSETNESYLKVVDFILDKKRTDHVVQSWISKPTILKCAIHKKTTGKPNYEWSVDGVKDITRGITRSADKTSFTFIPLSEKDFGKYKCTIKTASTVAEHEILLQQIRHASAPEGFRIDPTNGGRFVRLFWTQPQHNGGTKIVSYEVIVKGEEDEIRKATTELSAGVILTGQKRYVITVCSRNEIGLDKNKSCTKPREIKTAQLPLRGSTLRLKSHILYALVALTLVISWTV